MSKKDFLVDTGASISLLPFQSAAAATGTQLQAVNKQAIKTWDFVNTVVKFNGGEYRVAFLRADVPFPIVGLDFLRYFGMQVNPSSPGDSDRTLPVLPGRRHHQRRGFKFLFCV
jgi:predicted aspartyl protease